MSSRMDRYEEEELVLSRAERNAKLYETINQKEVENIEVKSNATVIGESTKNQIDIDQIKKILDTRYKSGNRRKSLVDEEDLVREETESELEKTKEYDINVILERAKDEKDSSYDNDRKMKSHDPNIDVLSELNYSDKKNEDRNTKSEAELLELINTISINEKKVKEINDKKDDLFGDLMGDDNTDVFEPIEEDTTSSSLGGFASEDITESGSLDKINDTLVQFAAVDGEEKDEESDEDTEPVTFDLSKEVSLREELDKEKNLKLDNTVKIKTIKKAQKAKVDEDENSEFEDIDLDSEGSNLIIKIIIAVIIVVLLVGGYFFIKSLGK